MEKDKGTMRCEQCDAETPYHHNKRFCSVKCKDAYHRETKKRGEVARRTAYDWIVPYMMCCPVCGAHLKLVEADNDRLD